MRRCARPRPLGERGARSEWWRKPRSRSEAEGISVLVISRLAMDREDDHGEEVKGEEEIGQEESCSGGQEEEDDEAGGKEGPEEGGKEGSGQAQGAGEEARAAGARCRTGCKLAVILHRFRFGRRWGYLDRAPAAAKA